MHGPNNFAFIDGTNLHLTYANLDWRLDYAKLREYLSKKFNITVAYYFLGNNNNNADLHKDLESWDYSLKLKDPIYHVTDEEYCPYCQKVIAPGLSKMKADCDSFLTLTVISDLHLYDKAVIITSDGDFDELVKMLFRQGKLRMVFAPSRDGCSKLLKDAAGDKIAFIDDYKSALEKV